jgi:hypothetical protein
MGGERRLVSTVAVASEYQHIYGTGHSITADDGDETGKSVSLCG